MYIAHDLDAISGVNMSRRPLQEFGLD
jgi:hypothetical protein